MNFADADAVGIVFQFIEQFGTFPIGREDEVGKVLRARWCLLVDGTDPGIAARTNLTAIRRNLAENRAQQGGFSRTVAANQPDAAPIRQLRRGLVQQQTAAKPDRKVGYRQHGGR